MLARIASLGRAPVAAPLIAPQQSGGLHCIMETGSELESDGSASIGGEAPAPNVDTRVGRSSGHGQQLAAAAASGSARGETRTATTVSVTITTCDIKPPLPPPPPALPAFSQQQPASGWDTEVYYDFRGRRSASIGSNFDALERNDEGDADVAETAIVSASSIAGAADIDGDTGIFADDAPAPAMSPRTAFATALAAAKQRQSEAGWRAPSPGAHFAFDDDDDADDGNGASAVQHEPVVSSAAAVTTAPQYNAVDKRGALSPSDFIGAAVGISPSRSHVHNNSNAAAVMITTLGASSSPSRPSPGTAAPPSQSITAAAAAAAVSAAAALSPESSFIAVRLPHDRELPVLKAASSAASSHSSPSSASSCAASSNDVVHLSTTITDSHTDVSTDRPGSAMSSASPSSSLAAAAAAACDAFRIVVSTTHFHNDDVPGEWEGEMWRKHHPQCAAAMAARVHHTNNASRSTGDTGSVGKPQLLDHHHNSCSLTTAHPSPPHPTPSPAHQLTHGMYHEDEPQQHHYTTIHAVEPSNVIAMAILRSPPTAIASPAGTNSLQQHSKRPSPARLSTPHRTSAVGSSVPLTTRKQVPSPQAAAASFSFDDDIHFSGGGQSSSNNISSVGGSTPRPIELLGRVNSTGSVAASSSPVDESFGSNEQARVLSHSHAHHGGVDADAAAAVSSAVDEEKPLSWWWRQLPGISAPPRYQEPYHQQQQLQQQQQSADELQHLLFVGGARLPRAGLMQNHNLLHMQRQLGQEFALQQQPQQQAESSGSGVGGTLGGKRVASSINLATGLPHLGRPMHQQQHQRVSSSLPCLTPALAHLARFQSEHVHPRLLIALDGRAVLLPPAATEVSWHVAAAASDDGMLLHSIGGNTPPPPQQQLRQQSLLTSVLWPPQCSGAWRGAGSIAPSSAGTADASQHHAQPHRSALHHYSATAATPTTTAAAAHAAAAAAAGSARPAAIAAAASGYACARAGLSVPRYATDDKALCYVEFEVMAVPDISQMTTATVPGSDASSSSSSSTSNSGSSNTSCTSGGGRPPMCAAVVGLCARSTSLEGPLGTRSLSIGLTSISGHVVAGGHCSPLMSAAVSSSMLSASSASNAVHSSHGARGAGVGGAHPHHGGGCCYRVGDVIGLLIRWLSSREVPNILWIEDDEGEEEGGAESSSSSDSASSGSGGQPRARPYDGVQVTFSINGRVVAMSGPLLVPHGTELHPAVALRTPGVALVGRFSPPELQFAARQHMLITAEGEAQFGGGNGSSKTNSSTPASPVPSSSYAGGGYLKGTLGWAVFSLDGSVVLDHDQH